MPAASVGAVRRGVCASYAPEFLLGEHGPRLLAPGRTDRGPARQGPAAGGARASATQADRQGQSRAGDGARAVPDLRQRASQTPRSARRRPPAGQAGGSPAESGPE